MNADTLYFTIDGRWVKDGRIPGDCSVCGHYTLTAKGGIIHCDCGAGPLVAKLSDSVRAGEETR